MQEELVVPYNTQLCSLTLYAYLLFHCCDAAVVLRISHYSRQALTDLDLCAHLLDLRALLFELRCQNLHSFLLLGDVQAADLGP